MISKKCAVCSVEFSTMYKTALYCSGKCRNKVQTARKQKMKDEEYKQDTKQCPVCGDSFLEKKFSKGKQMYCSKTCKFVVVRRNSIAKGKFYESIKRCREKHKDTYNKNNQEKQEHKYFGGNKKHVLERDGYKCTKCGKTKSLIIHHIDESGMTGKPNNDIDNLETLCRSCHARVHFSKHQEYRFDDITKTEILEARSKSKSWSATAQILNIHMDTLRRIRKQYGIF